MWIVFKTAHLEPTGMRWCIGQVRNMSVRRREDAHAEVYRSEDKCRLKGGCFVDVHADIEQNQEINSNMFTFTSFFDQPMTVFVLKRVACFGMSAVPLKLLLIETFSF